MKFLRVALIFLAFVLRVVLSATVPTVLFAQSVPPTKRPPQSSLSKPVVWNVETFRMFKDDPQSVNFYLETSWIPGEKNQGMLRYKLSVWVGDTSKKNKNWRIPAKDEPADEPNPAVEKLLERVHRCAVSLQLFDKDGFIVRKHVVPLSMGVDAEHARLDSLLANDFLQISAKDYMDFIAAGSWGVAGACE